jgi:hypothetical protein
MASIVLAAGGGCLEGEKMAATGERLEGIEGIAEEGNPPFSSAKATKIFEKNLKSNKKYTYLN